MAGVDTTVGGAPGPFPSTLWTQILHARDGNPEARRAAWEQLAGRYWKPVYGYIRVKWGKTNEDAKDLTQDFFAWMMEHAFPERANPHRGRFRVFVKAALDNYLKQDERNRRRLKRGGGRSPIAFEAAAGGDGTWELPDPRGMTAEEVLSRAWKEELLARATSLLGEGYRARGKETHLRVFQEYYLAQGTPPTHEVLAGRHGLSVTEVNHYLVDVKARFRELLRELIAETVESVAELDDEFRELFGQGLR